MRASPLPDLSRFVRQLGPEARAHLNTAPGFPVHHRATWRELRRLRRALKHPSPSTRNAAIARLRRRILGRPPSPRTYH